MKFSGKLNLEVHLVDGSIMDIPENDAEQFLSRLDELKAHGITGKALIHKLITDDWGPPPVFIIIKGKRSNGESVNIIIPYD